MPPSNPVIVIPGITATYLRDEYPLPPEFVWTVLTKEYERSALHPDDLITKLESTSQAFEVAEPARVMPGQLYQIAYEELVKELRYNLREREDQPVPVFPFGYDWRQPLEVIELQLAAFVEEVIEHTLLLRHYYSSGYNQAPKVNLVGHSMGSLIIAGYLARKGGNHKIGKVATIAGPFRGSFESIIKVATGTANLGTTPPSSREREAARLTPSLYYLVPSFVDGLRVPSNLPSDLFDPSIWQPSILESIEEFIRLHGRETTNQATRKTMARRLFNAMLAAAKAHRARIDTLDLSTTGLASSDWLCVVGVDATTRVTLEIEETRNQPYFKFHTADRDNKWNDPSGGPALRRMTGDGTVPLAGAIPGFLPYESLVCLTPDDFGFWEIADKAALRVGGFHGILPNMDVLHRTIVRFFTGRSDRHGNTWGRAAPGAEENWNPPLPLEQKR